MGGDGQALMNSRKHLLRTRGVFTAGLARGVAAGSAVTIGGKRPREGEGEEENSVAMSAEGEAWCVCAHSGEPLAGQPAAALVVDYCGLLYLRERLLAALIERAQLKKAGGQPPQPSGPDQRIAAADLQRLVHITSFGADCREPSADAVRTQSSSSSSSLPSSSPSPSVVPSFSGGATAPAAFVCGLSKSAAPAPLVMLWACGHCFSPKALSEAWTAAAKRAAPVKTKHGPIVTGETETADAQRVHHDQQEDEAIHCPLCEVNLGTRTAASRVSFSEVAAAAPSASAAADEWCAAVNAAGPLVVVRLAPSTSRALVLANQPRLRTQKIYNY